VPAQKPARSKKEWYSVSVDTLRGLGLLVVVLATLSAGFLAYRVWENRALEREALRVIDEVQGLIQRLQKEEKTSGFQAEYSAGWQSFQEARGALAQGDFRSALINARRSRDVLLSIQDALKLPGSVGQAQFLSIQGEVQFRRGEGGAWEEARSRVALHAGDYVRTSERGSAEIMFVDGTLYTVRPNTQFIVSAGRKGGDAAGQAIEMDYGWVDLNTSQSSSNVKTPGAVARVKEDSEAFVAVDKDSNRGRFGAFTGGIELSAQGGMSRSVQSMQQVVQTGGLLSEPAPLPGRPTLVVPPDNLELNMEQMRQVVLSWDPVPGSARYALQISRNHLFVDNVVDVANRTKTRATLALRGEGTFQWRVAAFGQDGVQGPWSEAWKFRVASFRSASGEKDTVPPQLDLEDVKSYGSIFIVGGRSEPGSRIEINGEQVKAAADGSFTKTVQLTKEGWSYIEVKARDSAGNEAVRRRRVFVETP